MRTDAQIASLLLAFTLPIRRYDWFIDPNGARDETVDDIANDFNLPIQGRDTQSLILAKSTSVAPLRDEAGSS